MFVHEDDHRHQRRAAGREAYAAGGRTTLRATIERALRTFLDDPERGVGPAPPIPVFREKGVRPGVDLTDNAALEAFMGAEPSLRGGVARAGLSSLRRLWPFDAAHGPGRR